MPLIESSPIKIVNGNVSVEMTSDESKDSDGSDIAKEHFRKAKAPELLIDRSFCSPELPAHISYT